LQAVEMAGGLAAEAIGGDVEVQAAGDNTRSAALRSSVHSLPASKRSTESRTSASLPLRQ